MIPIANTPCVDCNRRGHMCQAQIFVDELPLCMPCADGEPCAAARATVSQEQVLTDIFGEPIAPGVTPVRHVDPAEWTPPEPSRPAFRFPKTPADPVPALAEASRMLRDVATLAKKKVAAKRPHGNREGTTGAAERKEEEAVATIEKAELPECRHPDCKLRTRSKIGVCTRHFHWGDRGAGRDRADMKPKRGRVAKKVVYGKVPVQLRGGPPAAVYVPPVDLAIPITESECDQMFARCTPQQKAIAIGAALRSLLTAESA